MKLLAPLVLALSLCCAAVQAKEPVVQDGIAVKPLPSWLALASEEKLERQAALQYSDLMSRASEKRRWRRPTTRS